MTTPRPLPAPPIAPARCRRCRQPIVWAITVAGPNGRGGKGMPLDPLEDLTGNVAVLPVPGGRLTARVLGRDEHVDRPVEYSAMPHFATCTAPPPPSTTSTTATTVSWPPPGVIPITRNRRNRRP